MKCYVCGQSDVARAGGVCASCRILARLYLGNRRSTQMLLRSVKRKRSIAIDAARDIVSEMTARRNLCQRYFSMEKAARAEFLLNYNCGFEFREAFSVLGIVRRSDLKAWNDAIGKEVIE